MPILDFTFEIGWESEKFLNIFNVNELINLKIAKHYKSVYNLINVINKEKKYFIFAFCYVCMLVRDKNVKVWEILNENKR